MSGQALIALSKFFFPTKHHGQTVSETISTLTVLEEAADSCDIVLANEVRDFASGMFTREGTRTAISLKRIDTRSQVAGSEHSKSSMWPGRCFWMPIAASRKRWERWMRQRSMEEDTEGRYFGWTGT